MTSTLTRPLQAMSKLCLTVQANSTKLQHQDLSQLSALPMYGRGRLDEFASMTAESRTKIACEKATKEILNKGK